ncbi:putative 2-carboxy-D-arabinitol-1-phosphatase [Wolffia australiana]
MGSASLIASPVYASPDLRCSRRRRSPAIFKLLRSSCRCDAGDGSTTATGRVDNRISESENGYHRLSAVEQLESVSSMTGGAFDFKGATTSLTDKPLPYPKTVTLVRHGLSTWNEESRVQGSSNLSVLTEVGIQQAERCRKALSNVHFDQCFASPISRAKSTAEVMWVEREEPLVFLDSLKEAHLFFLEGMTNAEAKKKHPELYHSWREDPSNFHVDGVYPIRRLWGTAREAWREILAAQGESFLVVTHKSILRALICTALGLGPERFRAIDVNNGGISTFSFNRRGEAMLQSLNLTAHMYSDHTYQF